MRFNDYLAGCLWFPQVDAGGTSDAGKELERAVTTFCHLFGIETDNHIVSNPLFTHSPRLFDLPLLLNNLQVRQTPIYIFGTFTFEIVVKNSWSEIGLDLFSLPWFSPETGRAFKYISLLTLPSHLTDLRELFTSRELKTTDATTCRKAAEQLRWGLCHQFSSAIQKSVGHGIRDRLQLEYESWENISDPVSNALRDPTWSDLPCDDSCGLRQRAAELMAKPKVAGEQERLNFARRISALDCRDYRYAPAIYCELARRPGTPQFERIVILDDNVPFRGKLKEALMRFLAPRGDSTPDDRIVEADPKKSWELYQLADADGNSIIEGFKNEGVKGSRILACVDLDINRANAPRGPDDPLADVFGGQWILYGTASAHPDVPRMVVTGFRSQDLLGFAAGAGAYLLKPFTEEALEVQVRQAAVTRRVKWLCPPKVQDEYNLKLGGKAAFHQYADLLARRLHDEGADVEVLEEVVDHSIAESDLVIVDSCCADDSLASEPLATIAAARAANPRASLLLVVPESDVPQDNMTYYYRGIPLALRDGADAVVKKPTWIVGAAHHARKTS